MLATLKDTLRRLTSPVFAPAPQLPQNAGAAVLDDDDDENARPRPVKTSRRSKRLSAAVGKQYRSLFRASLARGVGVCESCLGAFPRNSLSVSGTGSARCRNCARDDDQGSHRNSSSSSHSNKSSSNGKPVEPLSPQQLMKAGATPAAINGAQFHVRAELLARLEEPRKTLVQPAEVDSVAFSVAETHLFALPPTRRMDRQLSESGDVFVLENGTNEVASLFSATAFKIVATVPPHDAKPVALPPGCETFYLCSTASPARIARALSRAELLPRRDHFGDRLVVTCLLAGKTLPQVVRAADARTCAAAAVKIGSLARGALARRTWFCVGCYDEHSFYRSVRVAQACGHRLCVDCFTVYFESAAPLATLVCPGNNCDAHAQEDDKRGLRRALAAQKRRELYLLRAKHAKKLRRLLRGSQRSKDNLKWMAENARVCPRCLATIQRSEGCNNMTCVCGSWFNWDDTENNGVLQVLDKLKTGAIKV